MSIVMSVVLFFFLCTMLLLVLVLFHFNVYRNEEKNRIKKEKKILFLLKEINNKKIKLVNYLKSIENLIIFEELYLSDDKIIDLNKNSDVIANLAVYYSKQTLYKKTYFGYFLSCININHPEIIIFLNEAFKINHIYCLDNIVLTTLKQGNIDYFIDKLYIFNNMKVYYSAKLLSDHMLSYLGNKEEFAKALLDSYSEFNTNIRKAIIIYCRYIKYSDSNMLYMLFKLEKDKECKLAMVRYFGIVKLKNIEADLIDLAKRYDFEYSVVVIKTLKNYNSEIVKDFLLSSVWQDNYYVMNNSLLSLTKFMDIKKLIGKYNENVDCHINYILSNEVKYGNS